MTTKSIHEFSALMKTLKINVSELGCVMLPVEPFDIFGEGREDLLSREDLFASNDPALWWVQGDVSNKAHITLLYGLLAPAYLQKEAVDMVLETWERPEYLIPEHITFFPGPEKAGYAAVVAEFEDRHLEEAHQRLSYLPHVDTFPTYRPHMTLAYVKLDKAQHWMDILNLSMGVVTVKQGELDYGSEK